MSSRSRSTPYRSDFRPVALTDPVAAHAEERRRRTSAFRRDVSGLALLAAASLCIGLLANVLRPHRLPLVYASPQERLRETVTRMAAASPTVHPPEPVSGHWQSIELDEFQGWVATRKALCIDARAPAFYRAGHVPGAVNLPREDFDRGYTGLRAVLEPAKERPVVVYCSEADCQDSELVAGALSRLGYRQLFVYKAGWEEWTRAGLPREEGFPF